MVPDMKDFVSVKKYDGSRKHVQKKLILCNLSELYANFKAQHPIVKICLSKFSQSKPRNWILAGISGTHTVCVCVHHANFNLILDVVDLKELTYKNFSSIKTYDDAMNRSTLRTEITDAEGFLYRFANACLSSSLTLLQPNNSRISSKTLRTH